MSRHTFTIEYISKQTDIATTCKVFNSLESGGVSYNGNAVWDTGATSTVIHTRVSKFLNLVPTGRAVAYGVNSLTEVNEYVIDIKLHDEIFFKNLQVIEANLAGNADVLVGMDIIGQGDFAICNAKVFSFALPSFDRAIDFTTLQ